MGHDLRIIGWTLLHHVLPIIIIVFGCLMLIVLVTKHWNIIIRNLTTFRRTLWRWGHKTALNLVAHRSQHDSRSTIADVEFIMAHFCCRERTARSLIWNAYRKRGR